LIVISREKDSEHHAPSRERKFNAAIGSTP
jgi:hypothetical protein